MINGMNNGPPPDSEDPMADSLGDADDESLVALGSAVLAELKDRGLLRVMLRNRSDAATVFEAEAIRSDGETVEVVAEGFHAETPDRYELWVREAEALHERLSVPGLPEDEAASLLGAASDEALLLELDRAQETDPEDPPSGEGVQEGAIAPRVAVELLRRGVIEDLEEP